MPTAWLHLVEIGYVEPKAGIPPDPAHLAELVRDVEAQGAKLVLVESFYPRNTAERVAALGGIKLLVLPPDGLRYFDLMESIVQKLTDAVK